MKSWLQGVPLAVFVTIGYWDASDDVVRWQLAWKAGGLLALVVLATQRWWSTARTSRLFLAANLYVALGSALAWAAMGEWLAVYGGLLRGVALFVVLLLVGVLSTLLAPRGFIDVEPAPGVPVARYSWYLCGVTVAAVVIAWLGRGDAVLEGVAPFALVLGADLLLSRRARRGGR